MNDKDESSEEKLVGCVIGLVLIPVFIGIRGWVLETLWRWLIVPTFALRPLSFWQAIGVSVVVGVFTMKSPDKDDDGVLESVLRSTIYALITYAVALGLGWVAAAHL